jgi:tRNA dimethylallyltransferase
LILTSREMTKDQQPARSNATFHAPAQPGASLPLIAIVGPTASGKSALAVSLAHRFGGEVLACDSTQVYRGFDIGTGKPSDDERRGIPHHLIDLVEPSEMFTAGEYRTRALQALSDLNNRGRLPIFTVGTGLYLRALLEGLAEAPARCLALRERLADSASLRGPAHLHRLLGRLDPSAAQRISPNDQQKLIRAIEICLLTGKPISEVHARGRSGLTGYSPLKIGLNPPRPMLYERIEARVRTMLERGWRDEVSGLLAHGGSSRAFEFIGYREMRQHVEGGGDLSGILAAIAQATRRYAKRQLTWFRKEPDVHWFAGFGDDPQVSEAVASLAERHISGEYPR